MPTYGVLTCEVPTCEVVLIVKGRLSNVIGWMGYMADVLIIANSSFTNVFERILTVGSCLYVLIVGLPTCFVTLKKIACIFKVLPTCFVFVSSLPTSFYALKLRTTYLDVISQIFPRYLNSVKVLRMCL